MKLMILGDDFSATAPLTEAEGEALLASYRCPGCLIEAYRNQLGNVVINHISWLGCQPADGLTGVRVKVAAG